MTIFHFSARSLQKNIDKTPHYISNFKKQSELTAISETKLIERKIYNNIELAGYNFIYVNSNSNAGGVGLYVKKKHHFYCVT